MHLFLALAATLMTPVSTHAASQWCTVLPADAAAFSGQITPYLTPLLDSTPKPMVHIHTEGTLPHQGIRDESIEAKKQLPIMRDAALAWRAGPEASGAGDAYYDLAQRYFMAWVDTYQPDLNPIDETPFDAFIETYAVIAPKLPAADRAKADAFLTAWAKDYIASIDSHQVVSQSPQASTWNNNWQSHRIKLVTMIAVALGDDALFADARRLFQAQVAGNILPDGEVRDFAERDALHYVIYDLEPLGQAALAARVRGEDWYSYQAPTGSSLKKGFAWLRPYAAAETPHQEFAKSKVAFDAQRAAAGEKGYSGPFEPMSAANVMWLGATLDPAYLPLAQKLRAKPPIYLAMCGN